MPHINHFFLDKQLWLNLRKQFLSWYFLTYCAIIATQCVSCALFWRDFSNALMAGQLPSSKSIKRLWCEQPLSPVRMKLKVIIVQSAGNSQRDEWWQTFNMDLVTRDASIRYWGSVSAPIQSFSADQLSGQTRPIQIRSCAFKVIIFGVVVKPHGSHKNTIKHHTVFMHYISSVLKLFHSLIWGIDE